MSQSYLAYTDDTDPIIFPQGPIVPPFPELQSHTKIYPGNVPCDLNGNLGAPVKSVVTHPYTMVGGKLPISGTHMDYETTKKIYKRFLEGKNLLFFDATKDEERYWIGVLDPPLFTPKPGQQKGEAVSFSYNLDFIISVEPEL